MRDLVIEKMLEKRVPLTQPGYLTFAYMDGRTLDDLGLEELARLPPEFL